MQLVYAKPEPDTTSTNLLMLDIAACGLAFLGAILEIWSVRLPIADLGSSLFSAFAYFVSLGFWIFTIGIRVRCRWSRIPRRPDGPPRIAMLVAPWVLCFLAQGIAESGYPRQLNFAMRKATMDQWVQRTLAAGQPYPPSADVGGYEASSIEPIPGGLRFFVKGCGFFRYGGGFAYSPDGPPPATRIGSYYDVYKPIGDGWYFREYDGG